MKAVFFSKFFNFPLARIFVFAGIIASNLLLASFAQAEEKRNDAGFAVQFGNSTNFGIQGKVGISDNFSLRPEMFLGGDSLVENSSFTSPVEFLSPVPVTAPTSLTLPALVNVETLVDPITTASSFTTPGEFTTNIPVIVDDNPFPTGTVIPAGSVLPAFSTVSSIEVQAQESTNHIPSNLVVTSNAQLPTSGNFEGIALSNNNAGTTTKKNNSSIGVAAQFINGISIGVQGKVAVFDKFSLRPEFFWNRENKSGTTVTGISYGLAATYDLNFDNQGKTSAYFGPKASINSGSGLVSVPSGATSYSQVREYTSATRFGLVAGVDQEIMDNFTIGANINFLPLGFGSSTYGVITPTSNYFDFGIHTSYSF